MTELIDEILGTTDELDPALLATLDEADRLDAFSRAVDPNDPTRDRALGILARSDASPGGLLAGAIAQIVADPSSGSSTIVNALSLAGGIGSDAVPIVLATTANAQDPMIALAAWRTLQQTATGEQLAEIEAAAPPPGDVVGDQAAFALSVIAYRVGIGGFELPVPSEAEFLAVETEEETFSISQSEVTEEDFERLELIPSGELYLVSPTIESTSAIDCGEDHILLCLDSSVQEAIPSTLLQSPALAGVVVLLDSLGIGYSVRYLVLTWPDEEGGFHLALHHPDGTQMYYGHAEGEEITESEAPIGLFFALDRPGVERAAVTFFASSSGVTLGGDMVSATKISGDRLEPEPD